MSIFTLRKQPLGNSSLLKTSAQDCNISCRFELDFGWRKGLSRVTRHWTDKGYKISMLQFCQDFWPATILEKWMSIILQPLFLCFRKMEVFEGQQNLLKTGFIVKFIVSIHNTGISLILTVRCTVNDTGFAWQSFRQWTRSTKCRIRDCNHVEQYSTSPATFHSFFLFASQRRFLVNIAGMLKKFQYNLILRYVYIWNENKCISWDPKHTTMNTNLPSN